MYTDLLTVGWPWYRRWIITHFSASIMVVFVLCAGFLLPPIYNSVFEMISAMVIRSIQGIIIAAVSAQILPYVLQGIQRQWILMFSLAYTTLVILNGDLPATTIDGTLDGFDRTLLIWQNVLPPLILGTAYFYLLRPFHKRAWIWFPIQAVANVASIFTWWLIYYGSIVLLVSQGTTGMEGLILSQFASIFGSTFSQYFVPSVITGAAMWRLLTNHAYESEKPKRDEPEQRIVQQK